MECKKIRGGGQNAVQMALLREDTVAIFPGLDQGHGFHGIHDAGNVREPPEALLQFDAAAHADGDNLSSQSRQSANSRFRLKPDWLSASRSSCNCRRIRAGTGSVKWPRL